MSKQPFTVWIIREIQKFFFGLIQLLTFEKKARYGKGADYFESGILWMCTVIVLVFVGVFGLPTPFWRIIWLKLIGLPSIAILILFFLKAKYREEMTEDE